MFGQHDAVIRLSFLGRHQIVANVARHFFGAAIERIAPPAGACGLEDDAIAGLDGEIVDLRGDAVGLVGTGLDQPLARGAAELAAIDAPRWYDLAVVMD